MLSVMIGHHLKKSRTMYVIINKIKHARGNVAYHIARVTTIEKQTQCGYRYLAGVDLALGSSKRTRPAKSETKTDVYKKKSELYIIRHGTRSLFSSIL